MTFHRSDKEMESKTANNTYKCHKPINTSQIQNQKVFFAFCVAIPEFSQRRARYGDYQRNNCMNSTQEKNKRKFGLIGEAK